jgi:mannose-6-phosphate isomerase-like protein (cupin superfamily)
MDRAEAETSEAFIVTLAPGEAPPLHVHGDTEQAFYVLEGSGELQVNSESGPCFPVAPGDLVRIPPCTHHRMMCGGEKPLVYLSIDCFLSGRPSGEPTWDRHIEVVCAENGWDFNAVKK